MVNIENTVLETNRLLLRSFRQSDLDDFYEYAKVDGVGEKAGWLHHENKEVSQTILNQFIEGKKTFAIVYKENNKVIGSLGLEKAKDATCEIGYVLSKDYWGQGLMPEAVKRVIQYCFEDLMMEYLTVCHFVDNMQSKRVIEKCGFTYDHPGHFKTYYGKEYDSLEYILFNPTFLDLSEVKLKAGQYDIHTIEDIDYENFYSIIKIPGILENAGHEYVKSEEEARKVFKYYQNTMTLGIYDDQRIIGEVKLKQKKKGGYELGCLLHPDYWGQGIMKDVINTVVEDLFVRFDIPYFSAAIFEYNTQSLKMISKCHFRYLKKGSYYSHEQQKSIDEIHFIRYNTNGLKLVEPTVEYLSQVEEYRNCMIKYKSDMDGTSSLWKYEDMNEWYHWVQQVKEGKVEGWVKGIAYLLVNENNEVVGMSDLRLGTNELIDHCYGYLGYSISPIHRLKGYATRQLFLLLDQAEKYGMKDVLVTSLVENPGSIHTILNNGGIFDKEVIDPNDQARINRYWIHL